MGHYKQLIYALFNIYFIPYYSGLNKEILQNLIQKLNKNQNIAFESAFFYN